MKVTLGELRIVKKRLFLYFALVLTTYAGTAISQQSKVPPDVWQTVQRQGVVRVIVGLNVPWHAEGNLSEQKRLAQREAIATTQDQLLAELAGTDYTITGRYRSIPGIGLEVGPAALEVLQLSTHVTEVRKDQVGGAAKDERKPQ